jgi:hypothetical protein
VLLHEHLSTILNFSSCDIFSYAVVSLSLPDFVVCVCVCVCVCVMQKNDSGLDHKSCVMSCVLLEFVRGMPNGKNLKLKGLGLIFV